MNNKKSSFSAFQNKDKIVTFNILLLVISVVAFDLFFSNHINPNFRLIPAIFLMGILKIYMKIDPQEYGLCLILQEGLFYWLKKIVVVGIIIIILYIILFTVAKFLGINAKFIYFSNLEKFYVWLFGACLVSPFVEELIYRGMLCPIIDAYAGKKAAIFISGLMFALLHYIHDNLGVENFIAGYFLAWFFLESKNIFIPVLMHTLGNFCLGLIYLIIYHV